MNIRYNNRKRFLICAIAMGVTCFVTFLLMIHNELTPLGSSSLAAFDCKIQYLDFFNYYKDVLTGHNRIGYSLTKGLGGNGVGLFSYYLASPLNLLMYFFDGTQANTVIDLLIFIKIGLAAVACAYFLQVRLYDRLSPFFTVLLSTGYGLMHYSFANASNLMWLDGMFLLPLMMLGTHLVVRRRSLAPLAVPTALSIFSNWYTGGINCLFCIIWLVFEFFVNELDPESGRMVPQSDVFGAGRRGPVGIIERFLGTVVRYGAAMVLGIAISAALFLPTISALQLGRGAEFYFESHMQNVFNGNMLDTITQYRIDGTSSRSAVSLYCGSLAAIGTFSFFLSRRIRIRQKIIAAALFAFTLLTYYWQPLFFVFSLLKSVDSYFSRYGYIGCLELVIFSAMYFQHVFPSRESAEVERAQNGVLGKSECCLPFLSSVLFTVLLFAVGLTVGNFTPQDTKGALETCLYMLGAGACTTVLLMVLIADNQGRRRMAAGAAAVILTVISLVELFRSGDELFRYNRLRDVGAYSDYVSETREQVRTLKEYDGGLYRISQIGWRDLDKDTMHTACYNDALAYNYMGVGGYTSSPENDQMYLLDRLGYKEDNLCMNIINTSFAAADSMLGVRYVFSDTDVPGMQKIDELGVHNNRATYYNPNALPLAFVYDGSMLPDHDYHNPFEYLEEIWTALSGETADIFTPLETEKTVSGNTIVWTVKVPEGNVALYGNLPTEEEIPSTLQVGSQAPVGYSQWLSPRLFTIPYKDGEDSVKISLTSENNFTADDEEFYALNLDRLQELSAKISKGEEKVSDFSIENGKMSCTVTAREGEKLFLIIPRTKGWNTIVNGEKTETEEFAYCLTVIPLKEGENRIEMFYRIPNLRRGIAVTASGIILLAVYEFVRSRSGR